MKRILSFMILLLTLASTNANAWFFFIPGSVTSAIADSITGDKGEHCVGSSTKVGDTIRLPDGSYGKVKYLSTSESSRCTNKLPIRALLDVTNSSPPTASTPAATNKTGIDPPTPVTQIPLPDDTLGDPVTPDVMSDGSWEDSAQPPAKNPISVDEAPAPPVSSEPSSNPSPSQPASTAQRLRELNALLKEGLIDKKDYAEKKKQILDAM